MDTMKAKTMHHFIQHLQIEWAHQNKRSLGGGQTLVEAKFDLKFNFVEGQKSFGSLT